MKIHVVCGGVKISLAVQHRCGVYIIMMLVYSVGIRRGVELFLVRQAYSFVSPTQQNTPSISGNW